MRSIIRVALLVLATSSAACRFCSPTLAADDKATSYRIEARIVDAAGNGQAGAVVKLFHFDSDWRYWRDREKDSVADNAGNVHFDLPAEDTAFLVRAKTEDGRIGIRRFTFTGDEPRLEANVRVEQPVRTSIRVSDETGQPIAGALLWSIELNTANGSATFNPYSLESCGLVTPPSSSAGELTLPELPPGTVELKVIHPDFAPSDIKDLVVGSETAPTATLKPGAKIVVRFQKDSPQIDLDSLMIDLRREPFQHPSTLIGRVKCVEEDGSLRLTVSPGNYSWLRLMHPDFVFTPIYSMRYGRNVGDAAEPFELASGENEFTARVKPTATVRGRVINEDGKPVAGSTVQGEVHAGNVTGPFAKFADQWTFAASAETDEHGEYELKLAPGRARVDFSTRGMIALPPRAEIDVTPDGQTRVPESRLRPIPKVKGVVRRQNGAPASGVVVRFRSSILTYAAEPVITGEDGQFELAPPWIPEDFQTKEPLPVQTVVAFHALEPLCSSAEVDLQDENAVGNVELTLESQDSNSLITRFGSDLSPWHRGVVPPERRDELAAISLRGKPAPALDGAHWLNTTDGSLSLEKLRGKYVLLQFWTTWCGPCHSDMPSLRLLDKLYRDRGLVIVGVHDNSMMLSAIEADVAKENLEYPIVVDHPDGRILSDYRSHGISGYPSYVLIGPDGKVIQDDDTVPGPALRSFKIEIIRQLLADQATSR